MTDNQCTGDNPSASTPTRLSDRHLRWILWSTLITGALFGTFLGTPEDILSTSGPAALSMAAVLTSAYAAISKWEGQLTDDSALQRWRALKAGANLGAPMFTVGAVIAVNASAASSVGDLRVYYAAVTGVGLVVAVATIVAVRREARSRLTTASDHPRSTD